MRGTLFLVVGPSGAGKDTLMDGARAALADDTDIVFARRVITRPADACGEDHEAVTDDEFDARHRGGAFMLDWRAHGLKYAIPATYEEDLSSGRTVIANVSRGVIEEAMARYSPGVVLEISASPEILAERLANRGRETTDDIRARLSREAAKIPVEAVKITILNDGTPQEGIEKFIAALKRSAPESAMLLSRKVAGGALNHMEYRAVIGDIVADRYEDQEITDFLVTVSETLGRDETVGLARARADFSTSIAWDSDLVVDKHSMGGIPGSRITMVVIPIVAAYGLTIPKTSSRAITSPAGTADAMEVLARVDLDADDVRRVVKQTNGCIAWNGRLNHSRVDEVMNRITRPLKLDTLHWSVSSILSKKLAAGATHCIIDVPLGPTAKVRSATDARNLRDLFMHVGNALGLHIEVRLTDGRAPIGSGIGPALEARDVLAVLKNEADAPADLRDKALSFAAAILTFDPTMTEAEAPIRVRELLDSGAAFETFERMCAEQGPPAEDIDIGRHTVTIAADADGTVDFIDCFALASIARAAGAPVDKGAGLDLFAHAGDKVDAGQPLYRIHARTEDGLDAARTQVAEDPAFRILEA
ncbi:MAG: phosphonate metabolism protein/1,5-bisphosphokinase (PRPP-forming) PhnN [Alphaproteobacteria bacterium]